MTEVLSVGAWRTNGEMIADVARLGYLDGNVLDATYGAGGFWTHFTPPLLTRSDRYVVGDDIDEHYDYRYMPELGANSFDVVVFDPPYRLSGRRDQGEKDERYGTAEPMARDDIMIDMTCGAVECWRVAKRFLLVKCQSQVEGGKMRWQTDWMRDVLGPLGARRVDEFTLVTSLRAQPPGRRQLTSRSNCSTLMVWGR